MPLASKRRTHTLLAACMHHTALPVLHYMLALPCPAHRCLSSCLPPTPAGWVVLGLPAGQLTVDRQLNISRPRMVLRGEGAAATTLRLTRSLTDLKGPSNYSEGFWVYSGGLLSVSPPENVTVTEEQLTAVETSAPVPRGSYTLRVASAAALRAGDTVTLVMQGGNGTLGDEM